MRQPVLGKTIQSRFRERATILSSHQSEGPAAAVCPLQAAQGRASAYVSDTRFTGDLSRTKARRKDIDAAKGLAILLVVFGHIVARTGPANVLWYEPLKEAIYAFHMPFFLYLSGYTAALSGLLLRRRGELPGIAAARAKRLLLPFFGLGVLVVVGKAAMARFMFVDNLPSGFFSGLGSLLWDTEQSPALFVWYLYVLFVLSIGTVALLDGRKQRLPWLLTGATLLFTVPLPPYMYLDRVATYAPFFLAGALAGSAEARWERIVDRYWGLAMAALIALLLGTTLIRSEAGGLSLLLAGTASLPALHGSVRHVHADWLQRGFLWLGRYSFSIYLFNTLFIGSTKGLLLFVSSWDGPHFPPFAFALMSAGVIGPIMLKHYVLKHVRFLDRLTD